MDYFSMMFGAGGRGWLDAALLIGLFWAALAHPDRIRSVIEFRIATILLGISIVIPVIIQLFVLATQPTGPGMGPPTGPGTAVFATAISPILTMLAVIFGVDSVTPRSQRKNA
jgi:hypothetical protein